MKLRVEAAYWHERPVYFETIGRWSRPNSVQYTELTWRERIRGIASIFLVLIALIGGALFTRYNMRAGRADQREVQGVLRASCSVLTCCFGYSAPAMFRRSGSYHCCHWALAGRRLQQA